MPLIPLKCPNCGGQLTIDSSHDAALCNYCGTPFVVKDAIVQNYIQNVANITADTVNVYAEKDFEIRGGVLEKYNGENTDVIIPSNVKVIGCRSFAGSAITSVTISESVVEIQACSFDYCRYLSKINIPSSVTKIESETFKGCSSLKEITIPDSVREIGKDAFKDCESLEKVTFINRDNYTDVYLKWGNPIYYNGGDDRYYKYYPTSHSFNNTPLGDRWIAEYKWTEEELKEQEKEDQKWSKYIIKHHLCMHCGGMLKSNGLFSKSVCIECGKEQNY